MLDKLKQSTIWIALLSFGTVFVLHFNGFASNDFWIQAAVGDYILSHFALPQTAMYSFTVAKNYPFLVHEWGASVLMSIIAHFSGESGFGYAFVKVFLAGFISLLIFKICLAKTKDIKTSLLVSSIITVFMSFRITLRAENFAFILFAAFLYLFFRYTESYKKSQVFLISLIFLLWVNIHGSFVLGVIVIGIFFTSRLIGKFLGHIVTSSELINLITLGIVLLLVALINPYGYGIYESAIHISTSEYMKTFIAEWQPTLSSKFALTPSFYFFLVYFCFAIGMFLSNFRKISIFDKLLFLSFAVLSFLALRHVVYFYMATAPIISYTIYLASKRVKKVLYSIFALLLIANLIFVSIYTNYNEFQIGTKFDAPLRLETINWLRNEKYVGAVFNSYILGDQLAYNFYSNMEIVVDSRTDLYGEDFMKRYTGTIYDNNAFANFIDSNKIKLIILDSDDFNNYFVANQARMSYLQVNGWHEGFRTTDNIILKKMN